MLNSHISAIYLQKYKKYSEKSDYMDGFCLQGELDLTLFYKTEGYWGAIVGYFKPEILNDRK